MSTGLGIDANTNVNCSKRPSRSNLEENPSSNHPPAKKQKQTHQTTLHCLNFVKEKNGVLSLNLFNIFVIHGILMRGTQIITLHCIFVVQKDL